MCTELVSVISVVEVQEEVKCTLFASNFDYISNHSLALLE